MLQGCMIFFLNLPKNHLYFYPIMLSEDPVGHTQSTNVKQSSDKPSQLVVGYLTFFMC